MLPSDDPAFEPVLVWVLDIADVECASVALLCDMLSLDRVYADCLRGDECRVVLPTWLAGIDQWSRPEERKTVSEVDPE